MMKYVSSTLLAVLGLVVVGACHQKQPSQPAGRQFTDEVRLRMTPVKNQGASSLCWLYAMLATIETEHLMRGDSVNLSPLYNARLFLQEQVEKYYLTQGEKRISLRGVLPMALRSFREHGSSILQSSRPAVLRDSRSPRTARNSASPQTVPTGPPRTPTVTYGLYL